MFRPMEMMRLWYFPMESDIFILLQFAEPQETDQIMTGLF